MARQVTCMGCWTALQISETCHDRWLTCPRCLAMVPTFETSTRGEGLPKPSASKEAVSVRAPVIRQTSASQTANSPDSDVHRDMKTLQYSLIILLVLGCLGYAFLIWQIVQPNRVLQASEENTLEWTTFALAGFAFATTIYIGIFLRPKLTGKQLDFFGIAGVGCLAVVSVFIVFCVGCSAMLSTIRF
jgi:hypothetical protein